MEREREVHKITGNSVDDSSEEDNRVLKYDE